MAIVADVSVIPLGEGSSLSRYAKRAIEELQTSGLPMEIGAMSTTVEASNTTELFKTVERAKEAVFKMGAKRVYMILRVDERRDKVITIGTKKKAVMS